MNEPSNTKKREQHLSRAVTKVIFRIVIIVVVAGMIFFGVRKVISYQSKSTKLGFDDIGELATQVAYCTEIGNINESRKLFSRVNIPFTKSTYIYSYDVVIKAGLDFSEIEWSENEETATITVTLPEVKTLSVEVDLDSFQVYLEDRSIFTPITLEENNTEMANLKQQAETDAIENGLYENARSNAEVLLRSFFAQAYDLEKYRLTFVNP